MTTQQTLLLQQIILTHSLVALEPEVNLQLDLDDIFIRVLGQEIPAPQPVLNLPANPAPIPQPQQVERRVPRNDDAINENLASGRAERSRRRQE